MVGRLRHEAGQTVVLFALLLPLFLGMGALAVDVGYWYVVKKEAQDAADAAALAAARDLDKGKVVATQTAIDYVHANMPDAPPPSVEFPYIPDDASSGAVGGGTPDYTKIEVTVSHSTGTFFGRVFGLIAPTVSRRAVAERVQGGRLAIYAHEYRCVEDAVVLKGDNQQIRGHVHSDGTYEVQGHGSYTTMGTYRAADYDGPACEPSIDPGNSFGGSPSPTASSRMSWPEFFTVSDFEDYGCTEPMAGEINIDTDGANLRGVYCADKFTVDADDVHGQITVIARQITIKGDRNSFEPAPGQTLLFFVPPNRSPFQPDGPSPEEICSKDMGDLEVSGSDVYLEGIVFDPCTAIRITEESADGQPLPIRVQGQLIGMRVEIEGDRFWMRGTGAGSSIVLSLFE